MVLDSVVAQSHCITDFLVGAAVQQQGQDLALAQREFGLCLGRSQQIEGHINLTGQHQAHGGQQFGAIAVLG